ncbi:MAG: XdhC family protein [Cyanobacteria bacterium REEB67]|nr:XdhC family protein [Cyanobacteria bacterium REEB67]
MSGAFFQKVEELTAAGRSFASVTIVDTTGSVPQDAGAKMLVDSGGRIFGTVGGGKVEARAIKEAQDLLLQFMAGAAVSPSSSSSSSSSSASSSSSSSSSSSLVSSRTRFCDWNLQKDVGMTCGGSVRLFLEVHNLTNWTIVIFGAGHCAAALIALLARIDCAVICVDHRSEWLEKIPTGPRVQKILVDSYLDYVARIPSQAYVLLMTMGHSTDKPILLAILRRFNEGFPLRRYPYLGVIGSKAKSHRLHMDVAEAGIPDNHPFYCPIGLPLGSNDPQEIAVSITAQLLQERDKNFSETSSESKS